MSQHILNSVAQFAQSLLPSRGLELVEVQFRREGHGWVLRLFIDHPEGVSLDHCATVSRELSAFLDVEDIIDHAYHLEVSSPGLERPLRAPAEFRRFQGKKAKVKMSTVIDGQKVFIGSIEQVTDDEVTLLLENGQKIQCAFTEINTARLSL